MTSYEPVVSRRVTVGWLVAALGAAQLPRHVAATPASAEGYGTDPKLDLYVASWPRVLSRVQLAQLAVLADIILPPDAHAPAPSQLGIPDFLDEWISAPYPTQIQDRSLVVDGLAWLDREAIRRGTAGWIVAPAGLREAMIADIAEHVRTSTTDQNARFFKRIRTLVVGAYYTTDRGMAVLGYVGNVALESYPPVSGILAVELETRMRTLGLL